MKYLLEDDDVKLIIANDNNEGVLLCMEFVEGVSEFYLEKEQLFELIGVLHHIQKQMK